MKKKVISKLLVFTFLVQLLSVLHTQAAVNVSNYDVYVEAENYVYSNWGETKDNSTASNGKYLSLYNSNTPSDCYYVEYTVSVDEAGVYDLDIASSPILNSTWSSDIYVKVNNDVDIKLTGERFDQTTSECLWYHADSVNLNNGDNTIRFKVKDKRNDGIYVAFLDAFALKKSESKIRYITSDAPFNVFEQSDEIVMKIQMNNLVTQNTPISWSAVNVYGQSVASGRVYVEQGKNYADISLYDLPKGYYEVTANDVTAGLCVVKPLNERTKYDDTPFAIDVSFSGFIDRLGHYDEEYAKVLALSGVSWVRDRANFRNIVTYSDGKFNISNGYIVMTKNALKPYGIKISSAVDYVPNVLMSNYSNAIPDNLQLAYEMWKEIAERFDGCVDNWEIMNEADLGGLTSSSDAPDLYAAYMKAAALGIADANKKSMMTAMTQGAAERINSDGEYIRMLMRNDVFDYSVADNTHSHLGAIKEYKKYYPYSGISDTQKHLYYQNLLDATSPVWVTESGIAITSDTRGNFSKEEQMVQAKYLVTSSVESIANGTDKHFFFIGQNYNEGEKEWGMMSDELVNPYMYASLSAQSAMTDILGEGIYAGEITDMPEGVHAYAFETNNKTVVVFWSEGNKTAVEFNNTPVLVYDMFGNQKSSNSIINATDEPTYAVFDESLSDIENNRRSMKKIAPPAFSNANRVIITQKYDDTARGGARFGGYHIDDENNTVTVEVTNLSKTTMTGSINGKFERGWTLDAASKDITLLPGEKKSLTFTINKKYDIPFDYLSFYGIFDEQQTSKSTVKLNSYNSKMMKLEAEENAEYYDDVFVNTSTSLKASELSNESKIVFKPFITQRGLYDIQVLASGNYKLYVNENLVIEVDSSSLNWKKTESIYLNKAINEITFVATGVNNSSAELDKIVISRPRENGLWIEAEEYSEKSGYYFKKKNANSSDGNNMRIFTFGIENPNKNNKLSYDFFIEKTGGYDVWILSTKANVGYLTKWKYGLDSSCSYPSYLTKQVSAGYAEDNLDMYWHRVNQNTNLTEGLHNITILADEERAATDGKYMLHVADAIVIAETGKWTPTGNIVTDRENYNKLYPENVNVTFSDMFNEKVESVLDDTDISVKINNSFDEDINVDVYCASYNAFTGQLVSVIKQTQDVLQGNTDTVNMQIKPSDYDLTPYLYKVFTWSNEMMPYATYSMINSAWNVLNTAVKFDKKLYISGNTGKAGESVSVMVLKPSDIPYEDMNALELLGAIEYITEVKTDFDGDYLIEYDAEKISDGAVIRIGSKSVSMQEQIIQ